MAGPELRVNNISQINTSAFVEKETNTLQNGSIRLGKSIYNVKFVNGDIQVKFKNWFLNLFNRNMSKEIKSHLEEKLTADRFVITESFNAAKKIGSKSGIKQVVLYGMSEVRDKGKKAIDQANEQLKTEGKQGFKATTVDTYNSSIGIDWDQIADDPVSMFAKIKDGTIGNNMTEKDENGFEEVIEQDTRQEWKQFLQKNADKVDIFKKISSFIKEGIKPLHMGQKTTGWANQVNKYGVDATLKGFILKQMEPDLRDNYLKDGTIDSYVEILKECVDKYKKGALTKEEYNAILDKHFPNHKVDDNGDHHEDFYKHRAFGDVIANAFFRQTSKLGLEFFQEKGIKVVFQWTNKHGLSMNTEKNQAELHNKWWLNNQHKKLSNKFKYGSITYSEMRHVERLAKKLGEKNLNVNKLTGTTNDKIDGWNSDI